MATLFLALALSLSPDAALRLYNPGAVAADVTLCGASMQLAAGAVADAGTCSTPELASTLPLVVLETEGDDQQRLVADVDAACGTVPMHAPLFACRSAVVVARVATVEGATYAWTAEGASIVSGAGTPQVTLAIGDAETAKLSCVISTAECSRVATAITGIRAPLAIRELKATADAEAGKATTITWSYEPGAEPLSQLLSGDAFADPVPLDGAARSYTFTPDSSGTKSVELRASYARVTTLPTGRRRRAAASTLDQLAACPSARASLQFEVRGCAFRPVLKAPEDALAGSTFAVSVPLGAGDTAEWSVENGTIVAIGDAGDRATILAGGTGTVIVRARVTSAACTAAAEARVPTYQRTCAAPPESTIELLTEACGFATVRATFTGAPPFSGMWSDRTAFRTQSNTLVHTVRSGGQLRIAELHDANCIGSASNSVTVPPLRPDATLSVEQSCGRGKLVARFTGRPPFAGRWSDGATFTTSDSELTRTVGAGTWSITALTDANCRTSQASSRSVTIAPPPSLIVPSETHCDGGTGCLLTVTFEGGNPPYVVEWTGGKILNSDQSPMLYYWVPSRQANQTVEVKRALASGCEATMANRITPVEYRRAVDVETDATSRIMCVGDERTFRAASSGATFRWAVDGAMMISAQGESELRIKADRPGAAEVALVVDYPGTACDPRSRRDLYVENPVEISLLRLDRTNVPLGTGTYLRFRTKSRQPFLVRNRTTGTLFGVECAFDGDCRSSISAPRGTHLFEVQWSDCGGSRQSHALELVVY